MTNPPPSVPISRLADGVLVINLDHRPERLEHFADMARTVACLHGWERIAAVNGVEIPGYGKLPWFRSGKRDKAWAGRAGCILSHRKAIEYARASRWDSVLIMEDDIEFADGFEQVVDDLGSYLRDQYSCWHACYLGFTQIAGPCRKVKNMTSNHMLYEVFGCSTTHAYLLRREIFSWILKHLPDETSIWTWVARHRAIDRWYARSLAPRHIVLAVSPGIVGQYSDFSDIGQLDPGPSRRQEFLMAVDEKKSMKSAIGFHFQRRLRTFVFDLFRLTDSIRCRFKRWQGF